MSGDKLFTIAILLAAIFIVWQIVRPKYPLRIVVDGGEVKSHQGVAQAQVRRVVEFFEHDVSFDGKVTVVGARDAQGVLRIRFRGDIDQGTAQQIRNFLKMAL